jgi:hypothetical protein
MKKLLPFLALFLSVFAAPYAYALTYTFSPLDYPGAVSTWAFGNNDGGAIVGSFNDGNYNGFLLIGDTYTPLDYPYVNPWSINNSGVIVGERVDGQGFARTPDGFYQNYMVPLVARGISDNGNLTGSLLNGTGFVGPFLYPLVYPDAVVTQPFDLNNGLQVVGYYEDDSMRLHGFIWNTNTDTNTYTYTPLDYPGAKDTVALGINDEGIIVGRYSNDDLRVEFRGFLLIDGNYLPLDYPDAWTSPVDINNNNNIVGYYWNPADGNQRFHGFTAIPTPEPNTMLLLSLGLVGLIGAGRKFKK